MPPQVNILNENSKIRKLIINGNDLKYTDEIIYLFYGFLLIMLFALEEREISCFSVPMNAFLA